MRGLRSLCLDQRMRARKAVLDGRLRECVSIFVASLFLHILNLYAGLRAPYILDKLTPAAPVTSLFLRRLYLYTPYDFCWESMLFYRSLCFTTND
jgi:hypothetical protein